MADIINVNTPDGTYPIIIEPGLLQQLEQAGVQINGRKAIATNTTVKPLYGDQLCFKMPDSHLVVMGDGEVYKNLDTVSQLYGDLVAAGLDRSSTVIALGGGVVGDTAGFAAATYMRGVRLVQVPTTLLSMVDSSVGGKVGVDLPQGKNLVGAFKQPDMVLIDPDVLQTLPDHEWRCGMAEVIKHGLLADEALLDRSLFDRGHAPELVRRAIQVKVDVVEKDPYEQNIRAHLNLGHTFAHAIERVTHYQWAHGEAVGFGLLAATQLSNVLGLCDSGLPEEVESILTDVGLPRRMGNLDPNAVYEAMTTDKKWQQGKSRFVLLRGIGQPTVVEGVEKETVVQLLGQLQ
ncbi:MAG: 3-dehydroquinate synthase [Anaerolineae bacterium]|nr:3-dehydroquinate synthase [Anaerolineae bacterium]